MTTSYALTLSAALGAWARLIVRATVPNSSDDITVQVHAAPHLDVTSHDKLARQQSALDCGGYNVPSPRSNAFAQGVIDRIKAEMLVAERKR